jgi:plastocyanin
VDRRFLSFVLVLLTLAAPAVMAQEEPPASEAPDEGAGEPTAAEPVTIDLEAHAEGSAFFFTLQGETRRNPTLALPPSAEVTVNLHGVSGFHNFQPDGFPASDYVSDGESITYTFTTPASGTLQYWCVPHKSSGMVGRITIGAASGGDGGAPAPEAPTSYVLEAHQEGASYFFTIEGQTQRNPTLYVKPGAEITITLKGVSGFHNIQVDGFAASDFVQEGQTVTYTFTAPESGTLQYWCVPHKSSGMVGRVQAGAPASGGGGSGQGPDVQGPAVDLASLGYADCAGYMIPQAAVDGVVGGPTVADYVEKCRAGDQAVSTVRAKHVADYVIPMTWLLIGLGVVGVVYVNRFYKP